MLELSSVIGAEIQYRLSISIFSARGGSAFGGKKPFINFLCNRFKMLAQCFCRPGKIGMLGKHGLFWNRVIKLRSPAIHAKNYPQRIKRFFADLFFL